MIKVCLFCRTLPCFLTIVKIRPNHKNKEQLHEACFRASFTSTARQKLVEFLILRRLRCFPLERRCCQNSSLSLMTFEVQTIVLRWLFSQYSTQNMSTHGIELSKIIKPENFSILFLVGRKRRGVNDAYESRWSPEIFFRLLYAIVKIAIIIARIILHLISYPQFTYDLFHHFIASFTYRSFTGTYEPKIDLLPTSVAS